LIKQGTVAKSGYPIVVFSSATAPGCVTLGIIRAIPREVSVPTALPQKIIDQMANAGLPSGGQHPFEPRIATNRAGEKIIEKRAVTRGPKKGKRGYVDLQGRIWVKDPSHAGLQDHWDVQIDDGADYFRVDQSGNEIP
jgi:hypothetical protein